MARSKTLPILLTIFASLILTTAVSFATPQLINYQGRLTDAAGDPLPDTTVDITFSLYRGNGDQEWTSGPQPVAVVDGVFSYILGSNVPLTSAIFPAAFSRYLGIKVGDDPELTPRTELVAVPYAYNALRADTTELAKSVTDDAIGSAQIQDGAILGADIGNGEIIGQHIGDNSIDLNDLEAGTTVGQTIKWNGTNWELGTDNVGGEGDITGVTAGSGLTGGGTSGSVTLAVGTGAVTSSHLQDGGISNADINSAANIATTKIEGTAVNLSSSQTITGEKTFDNLKIDTVERKVAISHAAFVPENNTTAYVRTFTYIRNASVGRHYYYASVQLPEGAIVTQVECTFYDNDDTYDAFWNFYGWNTGSFVQYIISAGATSGTPGLQTQWDYSPLALVDNENHLYTIQVALQYSSSSENMTFYGAEIEYKITRPLP